jgi:hypothetical protein
LDKRGFSENSEATEAFIYFLLSCISSIVIHNVMGGGLSEETIQPFTFLANQYDCSNEKNGKLSCDHLYPIIIECI